MNNSLSATKPDDHQHCVICCSGSPVIEGSEVLSFTPAGEQAVETTFRLSQLSQGYDGIAHGGIVSLIHDAAMVNCLFSDGVRAMTASLDVRFVKPVPLNQVLTVRAEIIASRKRMYQLRSIISSQGTDYSVATAKFLKA